MAKIIVREVFTAKPGEASKLAKLFKRAMVGPGIRVMTDLAGNYNTVVVEMEIQSLAEWEKQMEDYKAGKPDPNMDPKVAEEMVKYTEMYISGHREIFQLTE